MSRHTLVRFAGISAVCAVLVHTVEFHLGLSADGSVGLRAAWVLWMLVHCPLLPWLTAGAAAGVLLLLRGDKDFRRNRSLVRRAGQFGELTRIRRHREPIRLSCVCAFAAAFALTQLLVFVLVMHLMPMEYDMKMQGARMVMPMGPAIPVVPLCLMIGAIAGAVLAFFERTVRLLAVIAAELRRLIFTIVEQLRPVTAVVEFPSIWRRFGPALFSRPPPTLAKAAAS